MTNANKTRLIEVYYKGTLKGVDKACFEQLMLEDASFKQAVKDYKQIFKGLEALHLEQFQMNMASWESKHEDKLPTKSIYSKLRSLRKIYFAAASVALLICATFAYNLMLPTVFDQHFHASESIAVHMESIRAGGHTISATEQIKKSAFSAYVRKDYAQCISLLKEYRLNYSADYSEDFQSILVLAVAQLASDEPQKASKNLKLVMESKCSSYKQEAEWMWVLAQYKLENKVAAKSILKEIAEEKDHRYRKEAANLLAKM